MDCRELATYRDTLESEYDKVYSKFKVYTEGRADLLKIRKELLEDGEFFRTDLGLASAMVASNLKTTCNLIGNLLKLNPATGAAASVVEVAGKTLLLKTGMEIYDVKLNLEKGVEYTVYKMVLERNVLGQAVKTVWDFTEDVVEFASLPEGQKDFKNEVKAQLDRLDAELLKFEQKLLHNRERIIEIQSKKTEINNYIKLNCGGSNLA